MDFSKHTDGTTSVKVHHAPGGKSNISLGWGDQPAPAPKKQNTQPQVVQQPPPQQQPQPSVSNAQKESTNNADNKTSVKVHNPPGGKSNFTLG